MEAATIAKAVAGAAERIRNKSKNRNEGGGIWTIGISAAAGIVLLPAAFICCFFANLSLNETLAGNVDGVSYYKATYSMNDGTGNRFIYQTTSREEANEIDSIRKLFNEERSESDNVSDFTAEESTVNGIYNHNIELLLQWDSRWGGKSYGNSTIGKGGCGPTSLAMIINSFGGNVTPLDVANYSVKAGYRVDGVGTSWGLFTTGAKAFGLNGTQISRSKESIKSAIVSGQPIISSMTRGHFTNNGHFIVIADCNEDGSKVYIKDPNSEEKSKWWDTSLVINESAAMWAFAAA